MRLLPVTLVLGALAVGFTVRPHEAVGKPDDRAARASTKARQRLDSVLAKKGLSMGSPLFLRVFKEEAELEVWLQRGTKYELLKSYAICAYSGDLGPKEKEGDRQSPEGFYAFGRGKLNPGSSYHLSFDIGYPNAFDRAHGRTGSLIMVHGNCVSIGCFAMTDDGIEEIYSLADAAFAKGQKTVPVHVFPFRMTAKNVKKHTGSKWSSFWADLKVGYDAFESKQVPPDVSVSEGRYVIR
jgi:murein L,D-transpeptidase YafK